MRIALQKFIIALERIWKKHWPLPRGRYIPVHIHDILYRTRVLNPQWQRINGFWYCLDSRDYIAKSIITEGGFEDRVLANILSLLPSDGVFIDVGANIGVFTLAGARKVGPGGRVVAIEPSSKQRATLESHLLRNQLANVKIVENALSDRPGKMKLYLSNPTNQGRNSFSSLNAESKRFEYVDVMTGDELVNELKLSRVDLIKIDVEGAELSVLRGMAETLRRFRPVMIIEFLASQLANCEATESDLITYINSASYSHPVRIDARNILVLPDMGPGRSSA